MMFGGESSEHDVSISSAKNIILALDKAKYEPILCFIDRKGQWWLQEAWKDDGKFDTTIGLTVTPGRGNVTTVPGGDTITIDALFPVLHGKMGEDGTIQGLAQMMHVPIIGCNVESSALCMNKDATKRLTAAAGIPVVPWVVVQAGDDAKRFKRLARSVSTHGPWFVKPSRAGSSVGVSKVTDIDEIQAAVELALQQDNLVLIEMAVVGRELEVAVLGNPPLHKASGIGEIIPGSDFYDYDDKYAADSTSRTLLDANLPKALTKVIRQHALDTYQVLGCSGLARIDFLLSDELIPYMNEVNTMPGFTNISMYPKLWQQKGMSQTELIERLITLALE